MDKVTPLLPDSHSAYGQQKQMCVGWWGHFTCNVQFHVTFSLMNSKHCPENPTEESLSGLQKLMARH